MEVLSVRSRAQRGVALIVAMLLLVVVSIVALSAVRFSAQAMRIASNNEMRLTAYQSAQSVVDAAISDPANTPVNNVLGYAACSWINDGSVCQAASPTPTAITTLPIYASDLVIQNSEPKPRVVVRVRRIDPLEAPCPRVVGSSAASFGCAKFSVEAGYDHNNAGDNRGASEVREGVLMIYQRS